MDYYCYISRNKIDRMLSDFEEGKASEWVKEETSQKEKKAGAGLSGLLALFGADVSFGRSDVVHTKATLRRSYVEKLKSVLEHIAADVVSLDTLSPECAPAGGIYLYRNSFRVAEMDSTHLMATLSAKDEGHELRLDCSLSNFSETLDADKAPSFHSTNYAFFNKSIEVRFEALVLLMSWNEKTAFGSPVYLKLSSAEGVQL